MTGADRGNLALVDSYPNSVFFVPWNGKYISAWCVKGRFYRNPFEQDVCRHENFGGEELYGRAKFWPVRLRGRAV